MKVEKKSFTEETSTFRVFGCGCCENSNCWCYEKGGSLLLISSPWNCGNGGSSERQTGYADQTIDFGEDGEKRPVGFTPKYLRSRERSSVSVVRAYSNAMSVRMAHISLRTETTYRLALKAPMYSRSRSNTPINAGSNSKRSPGVSCSCVA